MMNSSHMDILVVDDNPVNTQLLMTILNKKGYPYVRTAPGGREALEMIEHRAPDLVLLDIYMPEMNGYQVCEYIKNNKAFTHIPVLMITGGGGNMDEIISKSFEVGATDFMTKPISTVELLARIKSAANIKQVYDLMLLELARRESLEKALITSEFRSMRIIQKSADGIIIVNKQGKILFVNPAGQTLFGRQAKDMVGNSFGFPMTDGETVDIDIVKKNGDLVAAEMRCTQILWENESAYISSLRDISARKRTEEELKKTLDNLQQSLTGVVSSMALALESRDPYTAGHQRRVADIACAIAEEMELPDENKEGLKLAAVIHDIGKIAMPAEILSYPGRLSDNQFNLIKEHSKIGYDILKTIEFPWPVAKTVLQHHEKMDGSGYPFGTKQDDIIIEARILTVSDVLEAMASHRPYRPALGVEPAMREIAQNKNEHYDPSVVSACVNLYENQRLTL